MKILYDYQTFTAQQYGGISRYFYELMNHFASKGTANFELGLKYTHNHYIQHGKFSAGRYPAPQGKTIDDLLWGVNFKGKGKVYSMYQKLAGSVNEQAENKAYSIELLQKGNFDLFHPTYYETYFFDHLGNKPYVITIYDMVHEMFPEYFSPMEPIFAAKPQLVENAKHVIAISESTKRDLVELYHMDPDKITVVHLASSLTSATAEKHELPAKYVLYVGNRLYYKNFYLFARAMSLLMKQDPELHLVCTGGGKINPMEVVFFKNLGMEGKVHYANPADPQLAYSYQNALAYVNPSLYEGFGIPVLEAFGCDCPAILSNISSLPEVGGDAAVYFEPKNITSMVDAIAKVIYDEAKRSQMIAAGHQQLAKFSYTKVAEETLAVYKEAIS